MKYPLIVLSTTVTALAAGTSFYLATLPSLTEVQTDLVSTANLVTVTGTTAIFHLLDDDDIKRR